MSYFHQSINVTINVYFIAQIIPKAVINEEVQNNFSKLSSIHLYYKEFEVCLQRDDEKFCLTDFWESDEKTKFFFILFVFQSLLDQAKIFSEPRHK